MRRFDDIIFTERRAFDAMIPDLQEHVGKFAVVNSCFLWRIFESEGEAYREAIAHLGLDEVFLVAEITTCDAA